MSICRTKTIKTAMIDLESKNTIFIKRHFDCNVDDFNSWYTSYTSKKNDTILEEKTNIIQEEENKIIFEQSTQKPDFIIDLAAKIRLLYNLKKEASGYSAIIYPPYTHCKKKINVFTIPKASLEVISRYVAVFGSKEIFTLLIEKQNATNKVYCLSGDCFSVAFGAAATVDISFDCSNLYEKPASLNYRKNKMSKHPSKRWVIVMDFYSNSDVILQSIKNEASKMANGDKELETDLIKRTGILYNVDNVTSSSHAEDVMLEKFDSDDEDNAVSSTASSSLDTKIDKPDDIKKKKNKRKK
jgi:hypothetical protein